MKTKLVKTGAGFTLIELLVVIAVIALLSSIALIALSSARQKSRDAKRIGDMTQMNNAMELYFANFKGYPSSTAAGLPANGTLVSNYASSLPASPLPADGGCPVLNYPAPATGYTGSSYFFYASGSAFTSPADNATQVYPDYAYFFCLGNQTGNFRPGMHIVTPRGVQ